MFRKHPLRDLILFLLLGITITFTFNIQAVNTTANSHATQSAGKLHSPY